MLKYKYSISKIWMNKAVKFVLQPQTIAFQIGHYKDLYIANSAESESTPYFFYGALILMVYKGSPIAVLHNGLHGVCRYESK